MMAKNSKTHKAMTAKAKSTIVLAVLLVITLVVSYIGIAGLQLGPEQSRKLLPWMPMSGELDAFTLSRAYGDVVEVNCTYAAEEGSEGTVEDVIAVLEDRFAAYGARDIKLEKTGDNTVLVTMPQFADYDMIASLAGTMGLMEFRDEEGNVLLNNDDFASCKLMYSNGFHYIQMKTTKEGKLRLTDATTATMGATMPIYLDGVSMAEPTVPEVNNEGVMTLSFGLTEEASRGIAAMLESGALPMTVTAAEVTLVENSETGALTAVLLAVWAVFALACVYMVVRYRAAGLGAAWTLWAYMLLFFFIMCTVTLVLVDTAAFVCIVAGEALVICMLAAQLKAMKQAVLSGRDDLQAVRLGLHSTMKKNWLLHGVLLVVALLLMILDVTRSYGYILATCAVASVAACMVLVRVFVPCLVLALGGKASAITGK